MRYLTAAMGLLLIETAGVLMLLSLAVMAWDRAFGWLRSCAFWLGLAGIMLLAAARRRVR